MSPVRTAHSLTCTRLRMDFRKILLLLLFCLEFPLCANCLPILPAENAAPSASESVYSPDEEPVRLSQAKRALRLLDTYERLKEKAPETETGRRTGVAPFQGDIILSDSTVAALVSEALPKEMIERRTRRAVMKNAIKRWPNATVPYKFASNFPQAGRKKVLRAISHWHKRTCIKFIPRSTQKYYIKFELNPFQCLSFVGMNTELAEKSYYDGQEVFLTPECAEDRGTIMHELGHVIGFYHEQNRPDRDTFIKVIKENIEDGYQELFERLPSSAATDLGVPYDFGSVMHYPLDAYSKDGNNTLEVLRDPLNYTATGVVGQRQRLSLYDARQANLLYACSVDERAITNPAVDINVIVAGQKFGLKVNGSDRQLWLGCSEEGCSLGGCPGNRFKSEKRDNCTEFQFTFETLNETESVLVGDEVILKAESTNGVVYCGANSTCVPSKQCEVNGKFSREKCGNQILFINVSSKETGDRIRDRDIFSLVYSQEDSNQQSAMISCHTSGGRKCRRQLCSFNQSQPSSTTGPTNVTPTTETDSCSKLQFIVYKLKPS